MSAEEIKTNVPRASEEKRTYSVQEIADILQVSKSMGYELCKKSLFKTVKIGKYVRISKASFDNWLENTD